MGGFCFTDIFALSAITRKFLFLIVNELSVIHRNSLTECEGACV